jgi:hypothetical protein
VENELLTAQLMLDEMVLNARDDDFAPEAERARRSAKCKTVGVRGAPRPPYKANPIERLWRDAQAVQFHLMHERPQLVFTGRPAMGLPPAAQA